MELRIGLTGKKGTNQMMRNQWIIIRIKNKLSQRKKVSIEKLKFE